MVFILSSQVIWHLKAKKIKIFLLDYLFFLWCDCGRARLVGRALDRRGGSYRFNPRGRPILKVLKYNWEMKVLPLPCKRPMWPSHGLGDHVKWWSSSISTFMLNPLRLKYKLFCQSYVFGIFLYSKYWSQMTQFLGCTSKCALVKEGMVQPCKLKFLLSCHLATNSFGLGRLFYKPSCQLQNLRCHGDQNGRNLEGCMVA